MKFSKNKLFFTIFFVPFFAGFLTAQPVLKSSAPKFQTFLLPRLQRTAPTLSGITVENYLETSAGRSFRGNALESVAREVYKKDFSRNFTSLDATYHGGKNGLDGLFVKFNRRGVAQKIHVVEIKSGNAGLSVNKMNAPQMSKKWILQDIDKAISEKTNNPLEKIKLEKARQAIKSGNYERYVDYVDYSNGRLKISQYKITGEYDWRKISQAKRMEENVFKYDRYDGGKTLANFSYLDKDSARLNPFERKIREKMFKEFDKALEKMGKTSTERKAWLKRLRTDPNFSGIKDFEQVAESVPSKKVREEIEKANRIKIQTRAIQGVILVLSAISEGRSIYNFVQGKISTSDLVFDSALNAVTVSSVFIKQLNPFMTPIFLAVEGVKNAVKWRQGNITTSQAIINVASAVAELGAFIVGAKIGGAIGTAIAPGPGTVIGGGVGGAAAVIAVNFFGQKIVNYYETLKEPVLFNVLCDDLQNYIESTAV